MRKRVTDADFVERILEEMKGQNNRLVADAIVKKLGLRIRNRARGRAENVNQAFADRQGSAGPALAKSSNAAVSCS